MKRSPRAHVNADGALVLPAEIREQLGLEEGNSLACELTDEGLRLVTPAQAVRYLQRLTKERVPENVSLADELIGERRAEAARETSR